MGSKNRRALAARRLTPPIGRCATISAPMSRAARGSCARRSTKLMAISGRGSPSTTRMTPSISSNICGSSMRRRCVSSASPSGSWRAPIPMGEGADHGAVSPRSGRDRQRRLHRLQPDPDLRRARDPRLDGVEAVACGNQRGRADRRPSRDAGDRLVLGSLLSGRHRGPARRSGRRPVQ